MLSLHLREKITACDLSGLTDNLLTIAQTRKFSNYDFYEFREMTVYLKRKITMNRR